MKNLVMIIDMQENFRAAKKPETISACKELLHYAIKTTSPVLFIEYKWNGKTMKELTSIVENYPYVNYITKKEDDGSVAVKSFFKRTKTIPKHIMVGGVNTNYCVYDTVMGLTSLQDLKLSLILNACNTEWPNVNLAIDRMRDAGVAIV